MSTPAIKGFDSYSSMKNGVAQKFAADGYKFSVGYGFVQSAFKVLRDHSECQAVSAVGMDNVLVWENGSPTTDEYFTADRAAYDASHIVTWAKSTGAPTNGSTCVYVAADGDCTPSVILAYIKPIHDALKAAGFLTGVYGSGLVCKKVKDAGYCHFTWLTNSAGFAGHADWLPHADIVQSLPQTVHGIDIDPDTAHGEIGGFRV